MAIKHAFTSPKADGADTTLVRPVDWNADHVGRGSMANMPDGTSGLVLTAQQSQDSTLTGWTTSIAAGDILAFNVDSVATVTRVTISIRATKT